MACRMLQKRSEILSMLKALPEAAIGVPGEIVKGAFRLRW